MSMPAQEEIVARIDAKMPGDPLGFEWQEYLPYLDYDHAKKYLKPECTREEWEKGPHTLRCEVLLKQMSDYMEFAWEKANNCRGISASRSISHYVAWAWLAGDREFSAEIENAHYEFYGKGILTRICEFYGWDAKKWDNRRRVNNESEDEAVARNEELRKSD